MNRIRRAFAAGASLIVLLFVFGGCARQPQPNQTKILLIGIDGATWRVITPLLKEGKLPNISRLMKQGVYGKLESIDKALNSNVIWTTIATGKNPEKHGITDWTVYNDKLKLVVPFRSYDRKVKAIWNILSERGKKVGVYRWLVSYPPEKVNGFLISDYYKDELPVAYPGKMSGVIRGIPHQRPAAGLISDAATSRDREINERYRTISHELENIEWLRKNETVDFFACYVIDLDTVQHFFWKFREPEHFKDKFWRLTEDEVSKYKDVIGNFYRQVDALLGRIIDDLDERAVVIIVSDHGFRSIDASSLKSALSLNKILAEAGLLEFRENSVNPDPVKSKVLCQEYKDASGRFFYRLTMNLRDRDSNECHELEEKTAELISGIRLAGGRIAYRISDAKPSGDFDMVAERVNTPLGLEESIFISGIEYPVSNFIDMVWKDISGDHDRYDGVIIVYDKSGGMILRNKEINDASVLDITPTLLYFMGLPVARDMDGGVLTTAIKPGYLRQNPVNFIETYDTGENDKHQYEEEGIGQQDKELLNRLQNLGYVR